jgi:hypothetical protein
MYLNKAGISQTGSVQTCTYCFSRDTPRMTRNLNNAFSNNLTGKYSLWQAPNKQPLKCQCGVAGIGTGEQKKGEDALVVPPVRCKMD